jgi:uncharacterized protein YdeI (BOF family)
MLALHLRDRTLRIPNTDGRLVNRNRSSKSVGERIVSFLLVVLILACVVTTGAIAALVLGVPGLGFSGAVSGLTKTPDPVDGAVAPKAAATYGGQQTGTPYDVHQPPAPGETGPRPHIVPTAGKSVSAPTIDFSFEGKRYSIRPNVDPSVYNGARASTRLLIQPEGQSDEEWSAIYYRAFAEDPAQRPAIDDVCRQLRAIRDRASLDSDQYLELIAKYVQSIPYDAASYKAGTGRQRFTVETLVEGTGMCGDKSVLLAGLLAHEGYAAALLDFKPEKHMAVGVRGSGKTYGGSGWLFLETTGPCYVTDVPDTYLGGTTLTSEPIVITIGSGTAEYGAGSDVAKIIRARDSSEAAARSLLARAKSETLTRSEANSVNDKLDAAYKASVSLRSNAVDEKGRPVGTFMDRTTAISWVDRNAWWL